VPDRPGMSVLVCFALKEEAAPFRAVAARHPGVFTLIVGIGRANAEKSIRGFLFSNSPELVLTCGFAGGLNPDLKAGDVIFETSDDNLRVKLQAAGARPAEFFCAGRIATTVAEKKLFRDETGCDAVEMESEAISQVCLKHSIPCTTIRVISDTAKENLPLDFNALAKSPGKIPKLMELRKKTKFAAERLADVLQKIIS
jgi:adenosylhomocysteine nucleosidase